MLHGKKDFSDVLQVTEFEKQRISWKVFPLGLLSS
jgi:hypothetical protein